MKTSQIPSKLRLGPKRRSKKRGGLKTLGAGRRGRGIGAILGALAGPVIEIVGNLLGGSGQPAYYRHSIPPPRRRNNKRRSSQKIAL